ncbi:MAG: TOBE domain-containing protein, partial [Paracoccaceae bacterium]
EMIEALGGVSYLHVSAGTGEKLILELRDDPKVRLGDRVGINFDPAQVMAFDATTELRLR